MKKGTTFLLAAVALGGLDARVSAQCSLSRISAKDAMTQAAERLARTPDALERLLAGMGEPQQTITAARAALETFRAQLAAQDSEIDSERRQRLSALESEIRSGQPAPPSGIPAAVESRKELARRYAAGMVETLGEMKSYSLAARLGIDVEGKSTCDRVSL